MLIRFGYELTFNCASPTFMLCILDAHRDHAKDIRFETPFEIVPAVRTSTYVDVFDNCVRRFTAPAGDLTVRRDAVIELNGLPDPVKLDAEETALDRLPSETLAFMLGSRYCETDKLCDIAWQLFGSAPRGWRRVQAICDFVCGHLTFGYQFACATRSAYEAYHERVGVCRDFAHLAVALCRCMNIPARYANGFLGDIGVPPDPAPMDYNAWFEAFLDGKWFIFDARHNMPRIGRITVSRGRDAADIPLTASFGPHTLKGFKVWTNVAGPAILSRLRRRTP